LVGRLVIISTVKVAGDLSLKTLVRCLTSEKVDLQSSNLATSLVMIRRRPLSILQ